jgi:hypothetical protein
MRTRLQLDLPRDQQHLVTDMDHALERLLTIGLVLAATGAVFQVAAHLINVFVLGGDVWSLDAEAEGNAWAWASSVATFTCAFVAAVLAVVARTKAGRLWFLAVAVAFLSLDDLVTIHESVGTAVRKHVFDLPSGWGRVTWPAIFVPLLAAVFLLLWRLGSQAGGRAGLWIKGGLTLLVFAVGLEVLTAPFYIEGGSTHSVPGAIEAAVEEAAELAGWILIATGLTVSMILRVRSAALSD